MTKSAGNQNAFLINWRNKSAKGYQRVSFSDLYRDLVRGEEAGQPLPLMKGKHLVIGASAPGIAVLKGTSLGPTTDDNEIIATMIDDLNSAIKHIDVVINDLNPLNGKCEYIKALIFLKFGDPDGACPLLRTSKDSGYAQAETTFQQYCANR